MSKQSMTVGLIGAGSVGSGWAASCLAAGFKVAAFDPSPAAEQKARSYLTASWPALQEMGVAKTAAPPLENLRFASFEDVVELADYLHENGPEDTAVKRSIYARIESLSPREQIICSSSGGIPPTELQAQMDRPHRLVIAHPFNPPHLIPLVEIIGGEKTDPTVVERTFEMMEALGKHPIRIKKEMVAYMANRLQFALLREAIFCLKEGVADAVDIDDALRFALAPRWAIMGPLRSFALAGGTGGMENALALFAQANQRWFDSLGTVRLDADVQQTLIEASKDLFREHSVEDWVRIRDQRLPGVTKAAIDGKNRPA